MHTRARTFQCAAGEKTGIESEKNTGATDLRVAGSERRWKHSSSATKLCMCVGVRACLVWFVFGFVCVCVCVFLVTGLTQGLDQVR